jgi:Tfp pilus assembly protein PilF
VRTVGIAGLGALGVSFGDILAMDSPAARATGEFHWGSTLWHEVAHTFTLGLSDMKVPRWLTEGISGWEEAHGHAGWGDPITPSFLMSYAAGRLPPVSDLTTAFIRPAYPEQVIHAYALAELVVEHLISTHGIDVVRRMLAQFADGSRQAEVFRAVLNTTPAEYDRQFDTYMRTRFGAAFAALQGGPNSVYATAVSRGRELIDAHDLDGAAAELERARTLLPEYAGPGSPYEMMAHATLAEGDTASAVKWLSDLTQRYAQNYEAWVKLADLRTATGDRAGAAAALEQAMYVHPYDPAAHAKLADLYTSLNRSRDAVRERRAIVALHPTDVAGARFALALALERAGEFAAARTEVLRALEIAPSYAPAQELLLRLQDRR